LTTLINGSELNNSYLVHLVTVGKSFQLQPGLNKVIIEAKGGNGGTGGDGGLGGSGGKV
jgi:hypothetical protein